jgi:hypothetical protein
MGRKVEANGEEFAIGPLDNGPRRLARQQDGLGLPIGRLIQLAALPIHLLSAGDRTNAKFRADAE